MDNAISEKKGFTLDLAKKIIALAFTPIILLGVASVVSIQIGDAQLKQVLSDHLSSDEQTARLNLVSQKTKDSMINITTSIGNFARMHQGNLVRQRLSDPRMVVEEREKIHTALKQFLGRTVGLVGVIQQSGFVEGEGEQNVKIRDLLTFISRSAANMERLYTLYGVSNRGTLQLMEQKDFVSANNNFIFEESARLNAMTSLVDRTSSILNELLEAVAVAHDKKMKLIAAETAEQAELKQVISYAITAVVGVLVLLFAWLFSTRSIARPINKMANLMARLSEGDLEVEIEGQVRKDELGRMARALNVFKDSELQKRRIEEETRQLEQKAAAEKKAAMMQLADEFEKEVGGIVTMLAERASDLSERAKGVASAVSKSSEVSNSASSAAVEIRDSVQTVAAAASQLSSSVTEISEQMSRTNDLVGNSVTTAEVADTHVASMSDAESRVRQIVQLIADLAGQTNLLALNATIESARAGEAGKGFAVVANEVKNLASQTEKSVGEISSVIDSMNGASSDIIGLLNTIKGSVGNISSSSNSVASAVEEQSAVTNEIASNIQFAAEGAEKIKSNFENVSYLCTEADKSTNEILGASEALSQQADNLSDRVNNFLQKVRTG